jgi:hypothetical protein
MCVLGGKNPKPRSIFFSTRCGGRQGGRADASPGPGSRSVLGSRDAVRGAAALAGAGVPLAPAPIYHPHTAGSAEIAGELRHALGIVADQTCSDLPVPVPGEPSSSRPPAEVLARRPALHRSLSRATRSARRRSRGARGFGVPSDADAASLQVALAAPRTRRAGRPDMALSRSHRAALPHPNPLGAQLGDRECPEATAPRPAPARRAAIEGRVADPQGAPIVNASVCGRARSNQLSEAETRDPVCTLSAADGRCRLGDLLPARRASGAGAGALRADRARILPLLPEPRATLGAAQALR